METPKELYDAVILGGGPAGLTAALYLARAQYRVLVLEKEAWGGQITITHEVVNYPGIPRITGAELTERMKSQAEAFGAEFLMAEATALRMEGDVKTVVTDKGEFSCLGVLLATGARPRTVGFRGEDTFRGRGVAYCATCDGEFFIGKDVYVVGGGYAAAEESVFLTKFARHVTVLVRKDDFSCAASVADKAKKHPKITVLLHTVLEEVGGKDALTHLCYKNTKTGQETEVQAKDGETLGVFVFAGYEPATELVAGLAERDERNYVKTDATLHTTAEGLFAAGDVCIKPLRQVVTATGDGALAATEMEKYIARMQEKTGLRPMPATKREGEQTSENSPVSGDMASQLREVFRKMPSPLVLKLQLDTRPVSQELRNYITALAALTEKLTVEVEDVVDETATPCVKIFRQDGTDTGLSFHGVPGGHEFTSFVLGLYHASGANAPDAGLLRQMAALPKPMDLKILVTLSCSMCPDLVVAAQQIAACTQGVSAAVYDIRHFPHLQKKWNVMSVPCLVVNDKAVSFGKQSLPQLLAFLAEQ